VFENEILDGQKSGPGCADTGEVGAQGCYSPRNRSGLLTARTVASSAAATAAVKRLHDLLRAPCDALILNQNETCA
jgi:hypothetical protein